MIFGASAAAAAGAGAEVELRRLQIDALIQYRILRKKKIKSCQNLLISFWLFIYSSEHVTWTYLPICTG